MGLARLTFISALWIASPVLPHEFWIEPQQYQVESGAPLVANLKNGQNFEGISLAWFEKRFTRFDMALGDKIEPVTGRMGDTPALQTQAPEDGLLVVLHETTPSSLTYKEWDKFLAFVAHKDFTQAVATHDAQGWPRAGFRESYTRHAKALIAIGSGDGADRAFGLETEIVALTNPFAPDFDGRMHVQINYLGTPRKDAQVEVFDRAPDGDVAVTLFRTDDAGQAKIPVSAGHDYLFDAVVMRPSAQAGKTDTAPVWETLWAALTFAVPAREGAQVRP